ncbi:MAG: capsular polysaccharide synthesis protein [Pseudomonadota bacterium]
MTALFSAAHPAFSARQTWDNSGLSNTASANRKTMQTITIWQYWETPSGSSKPTYITLCQEAVRKVCASCEVVLITPENLHEYLPDIPFDLNRIRLVRETAPAIALKADYVRIALLQAYGGMWLDSDCVPFKDLGPILRTVFKAHEFYGMRKTRTNGVLSNGAIGSVAGGAIVTQALQRQHEIIARKLERNEGFAWTELGASILSPLSEAHEDTIFLEPEEHFHPIHFEQSDTLWAPSDRIRLTDVVTDDTKLLMLYNKRTADNDRTRTRRQILNHNSLASQALRRSLEIVPRQPKPRTTLAPANVEAVLTTYRRPEACVAFVESFRRQLGNDIALHIAIQGETPEALAAAQTQYDFRVTNVPDDFGLSASRNLLLDACHRPVMFLCDDDFVFDERLRLDLALDIFSRHDDIGILGGLFENYFYDQDGALTQGPVPSAFNHFCWQDDQAIVYLPAQYLELERHFIDETFYFQEMQTVNNFALMRRDMFAALKLRWEDQCRIMGEHERFYHDFHAVEDNPYRVCYTNTLVCQHHRRSNPEYQQARSRLEGLETAMQTMDVNRLDFLGKRLELNGSAGLVRSSDRWWKQH